MVPRIDDGRFGVWPNTQLLASSVCDKIAQVRATRSASLATSMSRVKGLAALCTVG